MLFYHHQTISNHNFITNLNYSINSTNNYLNPSIYRRSNPTLIDIQKSIESKFNSFTHCLCPHANEWHVFHKYVTKLRMHATYSMPCVRRSTFHIQVYACTFSNHSVIVYILRTRHSINKKLPIKDT